MSANFINYDECSYHLCIALVALTCVHVYVKTSNCAMKDTTSLLCLKPYNLRHYALIQFTCSLQYRLLYTWFHLYEYHPSHVHHAPSMYDFRNHKVRVALSFCRLLLSPPTTIYVLYSPITSTRRNSSMCYAYRFLLGYH